MRDGFSRKAGSPGQDGRDNNGPDDDGPDRRAPRALALRVGASGLSVVVRPRPLAAALTKITVVTLLMVSALTLEALGVPYASSGGNTLFKIHPATYLSLLALAAWVIADGGPVPFVARTWRDSPGLLAFLFAIALLLFQVFVQKAPVTAITDNFILAFALFSSLLRLEQTDIRRLAVFMQWFFLANSLLGIAEVVGHFHMVPMYENGQLAFYDWRGRALLGHPLTNTLATSLYVITLAEGYGPRRRATRMALIGLHLAALVCFGGRTGSVLTLAALSGIALLGAVAVLVGRKIDLTAAAGTVLAATATVLLVILAADLGLFDRFLMRFVDDSGSADTRLAMLSIFRDLPLPLSQALIAPDPVIVHATQLKLNLAIAIESAVVGLAAQYGILVATCAFLGVGAYFSELIRRFGLPLLLPLSAYAMMSVSATSFSTKSIEIALVTTVLYLQLAGGRQAVGLASPRRPVRANAPGRRRTVAPAAKSVA